MGENQSSYIVEKWSRNDSLIESKKIQIRLNQCKLKKKQLCEALKLPCDFFSGWSENVGDWGLGNLLQCDHQSGRSPRQGIQNPGMDQS